jgi:hypothetical protein
MNRIALLAAAATLMSTGAEAQTDRVKSRASGFFIGGGLDGAAIVVQIALTGRAASDDLNGSTNTSSGGGISLGTGSICTSRRRSRSRRRSCGHSACSTRSRPAIARSRGRRSSPGRRE